MKAYFAWLAKFLTVVIVTIVIVPACFFMAIGAIVAVVNSDKTVGKVDKDNKVAVVELSGVIMDSREVLDELHRQVDDESIKGIVLRIDSPGGAVAPSQEIYYAVKRLKAKKPIVVSMGSVAASGGLYSALGASKIFAEPGTQTGSIGVIVQFPNFTQIADKLSFQMVTVKSGKLKDVGNPFRPVTPEDVSFLQETISLSYEDFVTAVVEGRGLEVSKVREFADGRVILGKQAKELGLIDDFGDTYVAARAVFDVLGSPLAAGTEPTLFYPSDKYREFKKLFNSVSSVGRMFSSQKRIEYLAY